MPAYATVLVLHGCDTPPPPPTPHPPGEGSSRPCEPAWTLTVRGAPRRLLAQTYHPDKQLDAASQEAAAAQFTRIQEAYEVCRQSVKQRAATSQHIWQSPALPFVGTTGCSSQDTLAIMTSGHRVCASQPPHRDP